MLSFSGILPERYRILEHLYDGELSQVVKCEDQEDHIFVVAKFVTTDNIELMDNDVQVL